MEYAISIKNIEKIYSPKKKNIRALNNISKDFEYGKFYLIVGHSGSGKSTLLRILGLIAKPTNGDILIDNKNVNKLNNKELASIRNKKLGFIFQEFYLDKYLKAWENVSIPMLINKDLGKIDIKARSYELLDNLGLEARRNHFPKELSGGEQQRVAIARSLANNPDIILADEPTGNLDIENEEYIFKKLKEMSKQGKCIIMVSHSQEAVKYADEVIKLEGGMIK